MFVVTPRWFPHRSLSAALGVYPSTCLQSLVLALHCSAATAAASPDAVSSAANGGRVDADHRRILADKGREVSRSARCRRSPFTVWAFQLPERVVSVGLLSWRVRKKLLSMPTRLPACLAIRYRNSKAIKENQRRSWFGRFRNAFRHESKESRALEMERNPPHLSQRPLTFQSVVPSFPPVRNFTSSPVRSRRTDFPGCSTASLWRAED